LSFLHKYLWYIIYQGTSHIYQSAEVTRINTNMLTREGEK